MPDKPNTAAGYSPDLIPLLGSPSAMDALAVLRGDFPVLDAPGPRRVAEFITGGADDEIQADVVGFMGQLLRGIDEHSP